jgi:hypothetical protein
LRLAFGKNHCASKGWSMSTMKTRTMTLGVFVVDARKSWGKAALVFVDSRNDIRRKAVIEITGPSDLNYLRERLDEIENDWKKRLGVS